MQLSIYYKGDVFMQSKLPDFCFVTNPDNNKTVVVTLGEFGYIEIKDEELKDTSPDILNELIGVSESQREAMHHGSLFGWNISFEDKKHLSKNGSLIRAEVDKLINTRKPVKHI